jgi:hypothetical protein
MNEVECAGSGVCGSSTTNVGARAHLAFSAAKSSHMRLVQSRSFGKFGSLELSDGCRDLARVVDLREFVLPRTVVLKMSLDVLDQISHPLATVIARTCVVHVAEGTLDRVGSGTIGRNEEQFDTRMLGQPSLHSLGFVDAVLSATTTIRS